MKKRDPEEAGLHDSESGADGDDSDTNDDSDSDFDGGELTQGDRCYMRRNPTSPERLHDSDDFQGNQGAGAAEGAAPMAKRSRAKSPDLPPDGAIGARAEQVRDAARRAAANWGEGSKLGGSTREVEARVAAREAALAREPVVAAKEPAAAAAPILSV
jgi:hypothetical protein